MNATVGSLTDIHSSVLNPLGSIREEGSKTYIYLEGCASVVAGDLVTYDEAFLATRSVASAIGDCAVALAAVVASKYGWFQIGGAATVNTGAAVADNAKLFLHATAGTVDDASVAGDQLIGAISRSSSSGAATITAQLSRPRVGVNVA